MGTIILTVPERIQVNGVNIQVLVVKNDDTQESLTVIKFNEDKDVVIEPDKLVEINGNKIFVTAITQDSVTLDFQAKCKVHMMFVPPAIGDMGGMS